MYIVHAFIVIVHDFVENAILCLPDPFLSRPHTKERKGSGYARLTNNPGMKFSVFPGSLVIEQSFVKTFNQPLSLNLTIFIVQTIFFKKLPYPIFVNYNKLLE